MITSIGNRKTYLMTLAAVLVLGVFASSQLKSETLNEPKCTIFGGVKEKVCPISFIALIANPASYNDRVIAVQGKPKKIQGRYYLFLDDYSAENNVISNTIACKSGCARLSKRIDEKTTLIGRFSMSNDSMGDLFKPSGNIDVMLIRELD